MPPGVHVESLQALADLERALARFARACQDKLPEVRREAERRLAVLESVCREREREVEQWRESYDQADEDDDTGYLAYHMEQAQEALHQARHWRQRCEESCHAYARQARQVESLTERDMAQARDFLRRKIEEIQEYQSVSLGGAVPLSGPVANAAPTTAEEDLAAEQSEPATFTGPQQWSQEAYQAWFLGLKTMPTPVAKEANRYEIAQAGDLNYLLKAGGVEFWADGITERHIVEVKCIVNPACSPYIAGSNAPDFIRQTITASARDECERISAILADEGNPLMALRVITNDSRAVPFFAELMRDCAIVGEVVMGRENE